MKIPKTINRYCPYCRKKTEHKVIQAKRKTPGSAHPLSRGGKIRTKLRGEWRGHGNLGKYSKGAMSKWKRYGKKISKKVDLRFQCKECGKMHTKRKTKRAKKVELK
ncbi:50S ribosomal protein L44e [Candidatus Woesearchaeota archaeon]|nr:MAG: 50S ribosomal protein L44e [Candidatus Woesearchaeota archaeon]